MRPRRRGKWVAGGTLVHGRSIARISERVVTAADAPARLRSAGEAFFSASRAAWAPVRAGDREAVQAELDAVISALTVPMTVSWVRQPHAVEVWLVPDAGEPRRIVRATGLGGCDEGPRG
jgi:hypothetical protein